MSRWGSLRPRPLVLSVALGVTLALAAGCPSSGAEGTKASTSAPAGKPSAGAAPSSAQAQAQEQVEAQAQARADAAVVLMPPGRDPLRVKVEVARTEPERRLGLMHRKHLDADAGMLFLFERPQQLSFWMRNTFIALDMIFITDALVVLGVVENAEPLTESPRAVPGDSQYVLEVNAGYTRAHDIGAGTVVRFEGVAKVSAAGR